MTHQPQDQTEQSIEHLKQQGSIALTNGELGKALAFYTQAVDMEPENLELLKTIAEIQLEMCKKGPLFKPFSFNLESNEIVLFYGKYYRQLHFYIYLFVACLFSIVSFLVVFHFLVSHFSFAGIQYWLLHYSPIWILVALFCLVAIPIAESQPCQVVVTNKRFCIFRVTPYLSIYETRLSMIVDLEKSNSSLNLNLLKITSRAIRPPFYSYKLIGFQNTDHLYKLLCDRQQLINKSISLPIPQEFANQNKLIFQSLIKNIATLIFLILLFSILIVFAFTHLSNLKLEMLCQ